jgi:phenylalanyl-tRNA synthetase alpha chain
MAANLVRELDELEKTAAAEIGAADTPDALEEIRVRLLGRKDGRLTRVLRGLSQLPSQERPKVGARANQVKQAVQELLAARAEQLTAGPARRAGPDLTLPGRRQWTGARHPVTLVVDEICEIFAWLGFTRARGPEAETEWHNFVALNTPLDHPAADMADTFYLSDGILLRSHTSPVQVRTMQAFQPPVRVVVPGMVYRRDTWDASHAPAFE